MGNETQKLIQTAIGKEKGEEHWRQLEKSGRFVKELWG